MSSTIIIHFSTSFWDAHFNMHLMLNERSLSLIDGLLFSNGSLPMFKSCEEQALVKTKEEEDMELFQK